MKIVVDFPPNIEAIRKTFDLSGHEVFCYGDTIYNPGGFELIPALIAHEEVHERQQESGAEWWWARYLKDPVFRLEQELAAHRVEYRVLCEQTKDRNKRAMLLAHVAGKLASPTYGGIVSRVKAMGMIRK